MSPNRNNVPLILIVNISGFIGCNATYVVDMPPNSLRNPNGSPRVKQWKTKKN